jgi:hypothetical protein
MDVTVALGDGRVIVGHVEVEQPDDADDDLGAAAVAWNAISRNGVFTVNGRSYDASECAEWWA